MTTVFTNGCFDLLHPGHVDLLARARALGTRLVVGINSDESVRRIKGPGRPVRSEQERAAMLSALRSVDEVRIFDDATPERLIVDLLRWGPQRAEPCRVIENPTSVVDQR